MNGNLKFLNKKKIRVLINIQASFYETRNLSNPPSKGQYILYSSIHL